MKLSPVIGSPIIKLAVAGLLGLSLAFATTTAWRSLLQSSTPASALSQRMSAEKGEVSKSVDFRVITRRNLFDAKVSDTGVSSGTGAVAPVNLTDIVLLGTIVGSAPSAVLQTPEGINRFQLNQEIPSTGRLTRVERNRVELALSSGEKVTLTPPEGRRQPKAVAKTRSPNSRRGATAPNRYGITSLSENRWLIPRQAADQVRTNFSTVLQQARLVPMVVRGETVGFSIVRPGPLLQQLGLRRGDVLQQVNGIPLDSPGKAMQIFTQLQEARNVSLDLKRGPQQLSFEYEVR